MDLGILFGFIGTWVLIAWAILVGGDVRPFINPQSMILVIGASCTVIFFAIPARNIKGLVGVLKKAFFHSSKPIEQLIDDLVSYAEVARRDGILSLENTTKDIDDPFIVRGIQMAVDGTDPELIEQIMEAELENLIERHDVGRGMLDALGKYAPAFGMIGTLIGLVIMLANLDDPSAIGPGMAVAILTTLYGAVIANAIALPLSDRLSRRSSEEVLYKTIIIKGVMAIQSGDNPRIVEQKLRTFLPPSARSETDEEERDAA
ncbi:motility protein A [Phycisphaerales bacterium AB-hyl4]|uniref:Motility protein A n=1 Tax=Natronomicrosphaera hydrolytica TaxID=3242702 RepID=A0ABV4U536_9BACT